MKSFAILVVVLMTAGCVLAVPQLNTKRTRSVLGVDYSGSGYPLSIYDNYRGIGYNGAYTGYPADLDDNGIGYYADPYSYDY